MNQKTLIGLGVVALGLYMWDRKKKSDRAIVVDSAEHSNCSGCQSNFKGGSEPVTFDCNKAGIPPAECQQRCKGTYDVNGNICEGHMIVPTSETIKQTRKFSPMAGNGWGSSAIA